MNSAEGKGPKQVKRSWPLGQFVTPYGNGNNAYVNDPYFVAGTINPVNVSATHLASVPYPAAFSGGQVGNMNTNGAVAYTNPGSINPGLNLSASSNGNLDVSPICSPGSQESLQDIQTVTVVLNAETGWSGTATVWLQGTFDRYTPNAYYTSVSGLYASSNWATIASGTVTAASTPVLIKVAAASGIFYNAYRLVASGGTGIIDWTIPGMFLDLSAQQVGQEAIWINGNLGQLNVQDNDVITISGGTVTAYSENPTPYENIKANHDYIG